MRPLPVTAAPPRAEVFTAEIAKRVSVVTDCHSIIATVSRRVADLNRFPGSRNRAAVAEYRKTIYELLRDSRALDDGRLLSPFLHLSLHGMQDRRYMDIELGTVFGESCSDDLLQWLLSRLRRWATGIQNAHRVPIVVDNHELFGDPVIATHRIGDHPSKYKGYGTNFNSVQIEIAHWLREDHRDELVDFFTEVAESFSPART